MSNEMKDALLWAQVILLTVLVAFTAISAFYVADTQRVVQQIQEQMQK